jgi:hypothetical protein
VGEFDNAQAFERERVGCHAVAANFFKKMNAAGVFLLVRRKQWGT